MKAIATCIKNLEFVTQKEIKEILKLNSNIIYPGRVEFEVKEEDLAKLIYYSRSTFKAYSLIDLIEFNSKEEILEKIKKLNFSYLKDTFVVRCERSGNPNFSSLNIEKEAGAIILNKTNLKVDLENATTTIIIDIINNMCFIGIDFTGIKLSKRDYRIKLLSNSINPCLAYSLLRIADYSHSDSLLDPFCKSGEILIEAAQYALKIPNCLRLEEKLLYKKLINIKFKDTTINKKLKLNAIDNFQNSLVCAEINYKIGLIKDQINFSKLEIEWLDTKFEKESIDKIVTFPPYPTISLPLKKLEKIYKELFYQLEFILNKNGKIVILTPIPEILEKFSLSHKLKKEEEIKIDYNNQPFSILKFKK